MEKKVRGQQGILTICCKNFDLVKLRFGQIEEALNVASSIEVLSTIGKTYSVKVKLCSTALDSSLLAWVPGVKSFVIFEIN